MNNKKMKTKKKPLVSIVTPSYNQGEYIEKTIKSVISQKYENIEYIVIDGGSSDETLEVLKRYDRQIDFWSSSPDEGQASAINKGWKMSNGSILHWLNSDDYIEKNAVQKAVNKIRHERSKMVVGNCKVVNKEGKTLSVAKPGIVSLEEMLRGKTFPQPSVFISSSLYQKVGKINEDLKYELDWEFYIRCLSSIEEYEYSYINDVMSYSRVYRETKTRRGFEKKGKERRKCIREGSISNIISKENRKKYIAETFILQGVYRFKSGKYSKSTIDAALAIWNYPFVFISKIKKFGWLIKERIRNKKYVS